MFPATGLLLLSALSVQAPDSVRSSADLIRAMHDRHSKTWYHTLSFVQRVIYPDKPEEEWWEAASLPGRLRIDKAPADSGNTFLFRSDSIVRFAKRAVTSVGPGNNWLLVLGFDVYAQPPGKTIGLLKRASFDLTQFRVDTWEGRAVYVVGADRGDEKRLQFWVDQERLLFVRLIQPGSDGVRDVRFNKYQPLGGGWIAPDVVFVRDGKEYQREVYRDMQANSPVAPDLFNGPPWKRAGWIPAGK